MLAGAGLCYAQAMRNPHPLCAEGLKMKVCSATPRRWLPRLVPCMLSCWLVSLLAAGIAAPGPAHAARLPVPPAQAATPTAALATLATALVTYRGHSGPVVSVA